MKLPSDFKISTKASQVSCLAGGMKHSMAKVHDDFGMTRGHRCTDCGSKVLLKKRKRKIVSKNRL